ncbi:uncharacterized protein LOC105687280 isoform X2 [Athalia rosae]|uniref:uncharacterized protein LOC105687280 isoform X2 n=1 Tax=Athalia rosae TaxID=37344 RepID=UPI002033704D|nr:uncharacterized protein LOC105687280 isoform X2 [Athalia rosae]
MTSFHETQDFYKKMLELQERLRKSEDERMKLEERFNQLSQESKSRREACINNLRIRYIEFLEEQRIRDERNHQIIGALDKIDGSLARMTARTDRLGILRKQYEAYLLRLYSSRRSARVGGTGDSGLGSHNEESQKPSNILPQANVISVGNSEHRSPVPLQTHYPQLYVTPSNISQFDVPRYNLAPGNLPQINVVQPPYGRQDHLGYLQNQNRSPRKDQSLIPSRIIPSGHREVLPENSNQLRNLRGIHSEFPSSDFNTETFGPNGHSTPLPGYLDYSSRYGRQATSANESEFLKNSPGFTTNDLDNVIIRNEQILPRDYLHNSESVGRALKTPNASRMKDDELEDYIKRIRSLHKENDQSCALDIEENTSGDLLNATLSEDGPEELPALNFDTKMTLKPPKKTLTDDIRAVLALADNFVAETAILEDEYLRNEEYLNDGKLPDNNNDGDRYENSTGMVNQCSNSDAKIPENSSISATQNDMLSGAANSSYLNNIRDHQSAVSEGENRPEINKQEITNPDTPPFNIEDVTKDAKNSRPASHSTGDEYRNIQSKNFGGLERNAADVGGTDKIIATPEVHEDIEGDKVTLVEGEQVIGVVRELQPQGLKHYEKNYVEICEQEPDGAGDKKRIDNGVSESRINDDERIEKKIMSQESAIDQAPKSGEVRNVDGQKGSGTLDGTEDERQIRDESKSNYKDQSNDEAEPPRTVGDIHDANSYSETLDRDTRRNDEFNRVQQQLEDYQSSGLEQTHETNDQDYHDGQQYQTLDTNQLHYSQDSDHQFLGEQSEVKDDNGGYTDYRNAEYTTDPNVDYSADPNEQYSTDPNEQYSADANADYETNPNAQYPIDPNGEYATDPNGEYATDPSGEYATDPNGEYAPDPSGEYATDARAQYPVDPNGDYPPDPNAQYANYPVDPNDQYGYYQDQQYEGDPNAGDYDQDVSGQQYDYGGGDGQGFPQDPNQESYGHDDPNLQGYNNEQQQQEYEGNEIYDDNQPGAVVASGETMDADADQQFQSELYQNDKPTELSSAAVISEERINQINPEVIPSENETDDEAKGKNSCDGTKKNKDVIRALLESDTDSTIERNPSNNTESDFDFN